MLLAPFTSHLQVNLLKQSSKEDPASSELKEQLSALRGVFESDLDLAEGPTCKQGNGPKYEMGLGLDGSAYVAKSVKLDWEWMRVHM